MRIGATLRRVGAALVGSDLPSWLDVNFVLTASAALAVVAVVVLIALVVVVRSVATRVVSLVVLGLAVFGLLHYRQTIDDCNKSGACACKFLGEDLRGGCATGS